MGAKSKSNAAKKRSGARANSMRSAGKHVEAVTRTSGRNHPEMLRRRYGLPPKLFARILGVTEGTLAKWEAGSPLSTARSAHLLAVARILRKLERSVRRDYIATWLGQPSQACADLGVEVPADLFASKKYEAIGDMIFFLGSGVAF